MTTASASGFAAVVDRNPANRKAFARVLRTFVPHVDARQALSEVTSNHRWTLLLVNYDDLSEVERRELGHFARTIPGCRLLLCSTAEQRPTLADLVEDVHTVNVLARNDGSIDPHELLVTARKLLGPDIFGIEKYFSWGTRVVRRSVVSSDQKPTVLASARAFAAELGICSRLSNLFVSATDELVTNALFDAPVDAQGRFRYAHSPRTSDVRLEDHEAVTVTYASDGQTLGVSVRDQFGSFTPELLVRFLVQSFRQPRQYVLDKPGGAGIGLHQTFEAVSQLVVNLEVGRTTEVIGLINVQGSYRNFIRMAKSFNVFIQE